MLISSSARVSEAVSDQLTRLKMCHVEVPTITADDDIVPPENLLIENAACISIDLIYEMGDGRDLKIEGAYPLPTGVCIQCWNQGTLFNVNINTPVPRHYYIYTEIWEKRPDGVRIKYDFELFAWTGMSYELVSISYLNHVEMIQRITANVMCHVEELRVSADEVPIPLGVLSLLNKTPACVGIDLIYDMGEYRSLKIEGVNPIPTGIWLQCSNPSTIFDIKLNSILPTHYFIYVQLWEKRLEGVGLKYDYKLFGWSGRGYQQVSISYLNHVEIVRRIGVKLMSKIEESTIFSDEVPISRADLIALAENPACIGIDLTYDMENNRNLRIEGVDRTSDGLCLHCWDQGVLFDIDVKMMLPTHYFIYLELWVKRPEGFRLKYDFVLFAWTGLSYQQVSVSYLNLVEMVQRIAVKV